MKISLIGAGKLGLCFGLNLEAVGYDVIAVDVSETYIKTLNEKLFISDEPAVTEMLQNSKNFRATTSLKESLCNDILFLLVATPSLKNGEYDHSQIEKVIEELIGYGKQKTVKDLIICCTVMPEYCDTVHNRLAKFNYRISYNPEFIAQGTIIKDQQYPDMVLIGEADIEAGNKIQSIYEKLCKNTPVYKRMTRTEAEICKLALNCFLTTKIAFANTIGDILQTFDINPNTVLDAIGSDSRIGNKYLKYGYGFGGPCFPRDNRAFGIFARKKNIIPFISKATDSANKHHTKCQSLFALRDRDKQLFDYITYKPESTIIVESQALELANLLANKGVKVIIRERKSVIEQVKKLHGDKFIYEIRS